MIRGTEHCCVTIGLEADRWVCRRLIQPLIFLQPFESKPGHRGLVASGQCPAGWRGGAGQGFVRRDAVWSIRLGEMALKQIPLDISSEARTNKIKFKPTGERNQRLTRSGPAVDKRLINRTASALRSWLLTSVPSPICILTFFMQGMSGEPMIDFASNFILFFHGNAMHKRWLQCH